MLWSTAIPLLLIALATSTTVLASALPVSPNDPLYDVAKLVQKAPEPPVCCLTPKPSGEAVEEIDVLSFEDWKAKQLQAPSVSRSNQNVTPNGAHEPSGGGDSLAAVAADVVASQPPLPEQSMVSPRFKVPVIDRFNYANLDCSSRVHNAHRSAKSPSSILSSKKDRYMLSPCNVPGEEKYVVIELCDDIRIDTVQLANFEFFSGVFKDFSVSVSKTIASTISPDSVEWKHAGTFRAKNVRNIQVSLLLLLSSVV